MNRQAITFLTLFSLILVLSIYYILLPPVSNEDVSVSSSTLTQIESMQQTLQQEREDLISQNNAIIAKSSSTSDEIASALAAISETKETMALEKKLTTAINELGFKNVFVEVEKSTIKVVVDKKDGSNQDANSIIKAIIEKTDNKYQVEVKFISDT